MLIPRTGVCRRLHAAVPAAIFTIAVTLAAQACGGTRGPCPEAATIPHQSAREPEPSASVPNASVESAIEGSCEAAQAPVEVRADPFGIVGAEGSLQALCDLAAANPCTVEMASVLFCTTTSSPDYDSLFVEFNGGLYHYLATHEDGIQRVVHLLERVERFATEAAASKVVGVAQWTTPSGIPVVAVTTRASYVNWEAEEALGWDRERLTACFRRSGARVATECGLSVPLYFEQWSGESPDGGFTATDGYVVTRRAIASAVAVPSPDGTLRHTLLGGSWHLLFGGDFFNPDPATLPTAADSILPIGL